MSILKIASNYDEKRICDLINKKRKYTPTPYSKYEKYFERKDKKEMLLKIKSEILKECKNISTIELSVLTSNIYEYCCLELNKVDEREIVEYFINKYAKYGGKVDIDVVLNGKSLWALGVKDSKMIEKLELLVWDYMEFFKE